MTVLLLAHSARRSITTIDGIELEKSAPEIHPGLANRMIEWSEFVAAIRLAAANAPALRRATARPLQPVVMPALSHSSPAW